MQRAHRFGVGQVERSALGGLVLRVASCQCVDVRPLRFRRSVAALERHLDRLPRLRDHVLLHGQVQVRPEDERPAPVRHGAVGVEPRGLLERAQRLLVIEAVRQREPLVEERLRALGLRAHRVMVLAEAGQHGGDLPRREPRVLAERPVIVLLRMMLVLRLRLYPHHPDQHQHRPHHAPPPPTGTFS